jgi:hypothetical protein
VKIAGTKFRLGPEFILRNVNEIGLGGAVDVRAFGAAPGRTAAENASAFALALASSDVVMVNDPGPYAMTGTIAVPAGKAIVGGLVGARPVLVWGGGAEPSDTASRAMVSVGGIGSTVEGLDMRCTHGDYRRGVSALHSDARIFDNAISITTQDSGAATVYAIFSAGTSGSRLSGGEIVGNVITGATNVPIDGMQLSYHSGARVRDNRVFDLDGDGATSLNWGIYLSAGCYDCDVSNNTVADCNTGGIHLANHVDGASSDYGRQLNGNRVRNVRFIGYGLTDLNGAEATGNQAESCDLPVSISGASTGVRWKGGRVASRVSPAPAPANSANTPLFNVTSTASDTLIDGLTVGAAGDAAHGVYSEGPATLVSDLRATAASPVLLVRLDGTESRVTSPYIPECTDLTSGDRVRLGGADSAVTGGLIAASSAQRPVRLAAGPCGVRGVSLRGGNYSVWVSAGSDSELSGNLTTGFSTSRVLDEGTNTLDRDATVLVVDQTSSTNLANAAHAINTNGKRAGRFVYVTSNATVYRARAGLSTSTWDPVGGGTAVTPV